ncbi:hypothetical protein [Rhizobium leguminosarum]|uniref:hypothetical protein n=1 Tax=Rhizobium leguminosarum TaxID=384 RepID=UPI003F9E7043
MKLLQRTITSRVPKRFSSSQAASVRRTALLLPSCQSLSKPGAPPPAPGFIAQADDRHGAGHIGASNRDLIAVMRRYFAAKAELEVLKTKLEAARPAARASIDVFYDPRHNLDHAGDLQRSHQLKGEMVSLMQRRGLEQG